MEVCTSKVTLAPVRFVFLRIEFYEPNDTKQKLFPVVDFSFRLVSVPDTTVVPRMDERQQWMSQHRVGKVLSWAKLLSLEVLQEMDRENLA